MKLLHGDTPYNFAVTASAMGLVSLPGYALYSATKAALRGFADAYRWELNDNQHFQVIYPVATKTQFFKRAADHTPVPWPTQEASVVAEKIIRGIEKDMPHIFPSALFRFATGLNRVFPFVFKIYAGMSGRQFSAWLKGKEYACRTLSHTPPRGISWVRATSSFINSAERPWKKSATCRRF